MLLCQKIRLQISSSDQKALEFMQAKCRGLYKWWIGKLRHGLRWKLYEAKKSLQDSKQHDRELNQVYGKLLAEVYFRIDKAMQAFYQRVKIGETPGFPRFRPRHAFFTLCYPASYLKVENNHIILPTGGKGKNKLFPNIQAFLTEQPPEKFKEVAVSRDSRGNYYCSFVYETSCSSLEQGGTVAFDLGVKTLAVGVNEQGRNYQIGGFKGNGWFNKQLDKIRSKRDKCNKGSRRYLYLSKIYQRVSEKRRNKQLDSLHKASSLIAYKLAESAVVIGEKSVRQMAMQSENKWLNRAVFNDWGLYQFVQMLKYKCFLAGKKLQVISERNTSKTCYRCGHSQDMPLHQRTYFCPECSLVMDRDQNSARNILLRYLARLEPHKLLSGKRCTWVKPSNRHVYTGLERQNIPMINLVGDVNIHRPWILVQIVPNLKTHVLARFRNRQDADDHHRSRGRFVPKAARAIVFAPPVKQELEERA